MEKKFLNNTGISYLWNKIKDSFVSKEDIISVEKGGTGANTPSDAIKNLGYATHMVIISDTEPEVKDGMFWLKPLS